ncbi:MAG: hypothetical protein RLZZ522_1089, partial [Verrucomicrobiota bacterium]
MDRAWASGSVAGVNRFLASLVIAFGLGSALVCAKVPPAGAPSAKPAPPEERDLSRADWLPDAVITKARKAVVTVLFEGATKGSRSGFFASTDGLVVTTASPLEGARQVVIRTSDQQEIKGARLMAVDPRYDLAVLATGGKNRPMLAIHEQAVAVGEPCAVLFPAGGSALKTADGKLLARRDGLDWTEARLLEWWSIAVSPQCHGPAGAPVITADGRVAGMYGFFGGSQAQKFTYAIPETALRAVLASARAAKQALAFPQPGEIIDGGTANGFAVLTGDPDFLAGARLLGTGDPAGALEMFRAALKRHPKNPVAMAKAASCLAFTGATDEAQKVLQEAIQLAPDRLGLPIALGEMMNVRSDSATMVNYYQDLTKRIPNLGKIWGALGMNLFNAKRKDEGVAALQKWTELEPDSMAAWDAYSRALTAA